MIDLKREYTGTSEFDRALTAWGLGYVLVGLGVATLFAWPVYRSLRVVEIAAFTAVVSVLLTLFRLRVPQKSWMTAPLAVCVYLVFVVPLAVPGSAASAGRWFAGLLDGIAGIVVGWKQILTLSLPLGDYQAVLVPFFLVVFLCTILACVSISSGGRAGALAVPLVFVMCSFGVVFGSSSPGIPIVLLDVTIPLAAPVALGLILLLSSAAFLIGRTRLIRRQALRRARSLEGSANGATVRQRKETFTRSARRGSLSAALVIIAVISGVSLAPDLADIRPRQAVRDAVDPVLVVRQQSSPLSEYRRWFDAADYSAPLFTVTGATALTDRIRLATLDSYDGEAFHVSGAAGEETGRFSRVPQSTPAGAATAPITITIGSGYSGIWVPVPDRLAASPQFTGSRADELADGFYVSSVDSSAIDIAAPAGEVSARSSGLGLHAGDSYHVSSIQHADSPPELEPGTSGKSLIAIADYPQLVDWVTLQNVPRSRSGLTDLIDRLRARGYLSHSISDGADASKWIAAISARADYSFQASYSGHSRARIESLFSSLASQQRHAGKGAPEATLVAGIGDDEQFATAAALLARYQGFESRVVVGVRLSTTDAALAEPPCQTVCTGANVSAWVEVRSPGKSWVTFDTSPQFQTAPNSLSNGVRLPHSPTVPEEQQGTELDPPVSNRDSADRQVTAPAAGSPAPFSLLPILRVSALVVLAVLLLAIPAAMISLMKYLRRRRRRRSAATEVSIVGAWAELMDVYLDHRITKSVRGTRLEQAESIGRPGALSLAAVADKAVFGEHPPDAGARVEAWHRVANEIRELESLLTRGQKLRAAVSVTSFMHHARVEFTSGQKSPVRSGAPATDRTGGDEMPPAEVAPVTPAPADSAVAAPSIGLLCISAVSPRPPGGVPRPEASAHFSPLRPPPVPTGTHHHPPIAVPPAVPPFQLSTSGVRSAPSDEYNPWARRALTAAAAVGDVTRSVEPTPLPGSISVRVPKKKVGRSDDRVRDTTERAVRRRGTVPPNARPPLDPETGAPTSVGDVSAEVPRTTLDSTVVVHRRVPIRWSLQLENGPTIPVWATTVLLGRDRPDDDPVDTIPKVQRIAIAGGTRAGSITPARLELNDGIWTITALGSTGEVILLHSDSDVRTLLEPGAAAQVNGRFQIGQVSMQLNPERGASA